MTGLILHPAIHNLAAKPQWLGHVYGTQLGDACGLTVHAELVVGQPEPTDFLPALTITREPGAGFGICLLDPVVGIDRLTQISQRLLWCALRHFADERKRRLNMSPKLLLQFIPVNFLTALFARLVLIKCPIPGEARNSSRPVEVLFLLRCWIKSDFMGANA